MSNRINGRYLYVHDEKQFYTFNANGKRGKIYRCRNRKCKSRVMITVEDVCIKLNNTANHNHVDTCEDEMKKLSAMQKIKNKLSNLSAGDSGSKVVKPRDVFKEVIVQ